MSWWETYLANETLEQAQARAVGYLDMIRKHTQQITGLYKRLEDAEERLKEPTGNPPVAPATVVETNRANCRGIDRMPNSYCGADPTSKP